MTAESKAQRPEIHNIAKRGCPLGVSTGNQGQTVGDEQSEVTLAISRPIIIRPLSESCDRLQDLSLLSYPTTRTVSRPRMRMASVLSERSERWGGKQPANEKRLNRTSLLEDNMRRRELIGAMAGTSIATLSGCTGNSDGGSGGGSDGGSDGSDGSSGDGSKETIDFRVGSFAPKKSFYIARFTYPVWVEKVNNKLDEYELNPEYLGSGAVGGPGELYDLAAEGTVDMAVDLPAYQGGRMPLSQFVSVPGLFPATTEGLASACQAIHEMATPGGESELLYNEYSDLGVRPIMSYSAGPSQLHTKKRISSVSELEGIRVVASGSQGQVAKRLGMSTATIASPDIHSALQSGTVDGNITPLAATFANGWYDQIHYATTNLNLGGFHIGWVIGQNTLDDLPDPVSEAMIAAGKETVAELASNIQQGIEDVLLTSENVTQEEPVDKGSQYLIYETEAADAVHSETNAVVDDWIESKGDIPAEEGIDMYRSLQENYRG